MLMNPELQGIVPAHADAETAVRVVARQIPQRLSNKLRLARLLLTLLPVPVYCAVEAIVEFENPQVLWFLLLTPLAMLWYAVDYFLHNALARRVIKEVAHYGLFLTPAVTLVVASLQPIGEALALAKVMVFWGEMACCLPLALVLWQERRTEAR